MMGKQRGFTIIEVMLFLGISGMLFVIAFSYMNGTIRETSFTDDTNQVTTFIERQYQTVKNSQATRGNDSTARCDTADATDTAQAPGASNTCLVLGKLLYFNASNSTINVSTIVGNAKVSKSTSELETIRLLNPRLVATTSSVIVDDTFSLSTRMQFSQQQYLSAAMTPSPFNVLALIRSPLSENVYVASWETPPSGAANVSTYNSGTTSIVSKVTQVSGAYPYVSKPVLICMKEDGSTNRRAAIEIPSGQATDRITKTATVKDAPLGSGMSCNL